MTTNLKASHPFRVWIATVGGKPVALFHMPYHFRHLYAHCWACMAYRLPAETQVFEFGVEVEQ